MQVNRYHMICCDHNNDLNVLQTENVSELGVKLFIFSSQVVTKSEVLY